MTDAISEEELRRSKRTKQIQEYQQHIEALEKAEEKPIGNVRGKRVHQISSEYSPLVNLFQRMSATTPY